MRHFQNLGATLETFLKDGKSAAQFFSRENLVFSELDGIVTFSFCERTISHPHHFSSSIEFWESISKILQVLLLQLLQKVVEDNVPKMVEYLTPLLVPHEESVS